MTGPLKNPRHEKFVQGLLEGKSATDAHELAGYARDDGNATRLRANPKVRERLAELQADVAKQSKVTVESLLNELEDARKQATNLDQLSAAVRAIEAKVKVSGLLVQKMEIGGAGEFSRCESIEDVADEILRYQTFYTPPSKQDRRGLIDLLTQHSVIIQEYIAAIKARPVSEIDVRRSHRQLP
jgi:phage terminase small subunit